ncbi:type II secretion system protein GspD [Vibrio alginolyticus]|uniref:type II secretion system protein GspD n=1 Tax=Vibrio alginolyticus TaxID=663 RepID=UPI0039815652
MKKAIVSLLAAIIVTASSSSFAFDAPNEVISLNDFVNLVSNDLSLNIIIDKEIEEENVKIFGSNTNKTTQEIFAAVIQANKLKLEATNNIVIIRRNNEVNFDYDTITYKIKSDAKVVAENLEKEFDWVEKQYGYNCKFTSEQTNNVNAVCPADVIPLVNRRVMPLLGIEKQILVKAYITETTDGNFTNIGMKYGLKTDNAGITYKLDKGILDAAMQSLEASLVVDKFSAFIQLSESENKIKTVGRPTILISDKQNGSINAVSQVPIATSTERDDDNDKEKTNIEYKSVGVMLDVYAEIVSEDKVKLTISGEMSSVEEYSGSINPTIKTSRINTTTIIKQDEMINLGGVITTQEIEERSGIPVLKEIPLLKYLFSVEDNREQKKELSIMITAKIKND